jgi:hypothetical protein
MKKWPNPKLVGKSKRIRNQKYWCPKGIFEKFLF